MHPEIAARIALETQDAGERERSFFDRWSSFASDAVAKAPGLARHLDGIDIAAVTSREALAALPVLRKDAMMDAQRADPPFGGFAILPADTGTRFFLSPGPVFEPQPVGLDPWNAACALHAAGIGAGDIVLNSFSYHLTPGAWFLDEGARALGAHVIPGGIGNTAQQVDAAAFLGATAYVGTPDFLKSILETADAAGIDISNLSKALVSGGALFPEIRAYYNRAGIAVAQCYATADCGVIAFEERYDDGHPVPGLVVAENILVEIVHPGTGDPVAPGEVGEIVVTTLNTTYPLVRFATGDLSKVLDLPSPHGRTNMRLAGWMGRADQRTKIKGMFVDPRQIAEIRKRHPEIRRARLVVTRENDRDAMTLKVEAEGGDADAFADTLREVTKLSGGVETVTHGELPNDGKVIDDLRDYSN